MATWSFIITIGATPHDITNLVDIRSIARDRRLHSELKANVDKLSFRMLLDPTIYPLLLAAPTVEIAVTRDAAAFFTGYVSPNFKTPIRNGQKYITMTAEDPSLLGLGKTITEALVYAGYAVCNPAAPAASLVHVIAAAAGVSVAVSVPTISAVIPLLCALPDDKATYAKVLDELLYQYRHVRSFNESGALEIFPVINSGDITTTATLTTESGSQNIVGELVQNKSPREYDDIRVSYKKVELKTGIVVFQDTSGGTADHSCEITLAAYDDADKKDYYPLTSDAGEVFSSWKSPDGYDILAVVDPVFDEVHETGIAVLTALTNYYKKFSFAFRNTDVDDQKKITRLKVTGNAYVVVAKNIARSDVAAGKDLLEISAEHVFDETAAADLAKALAQYYKYSSLSFEAKSKAVLTKGQYVLVDDPVYSGISAACRVVGIIDQEKTPGIYTYTLEAVADFVAAGIIIEGQSEPLDDSGNNDESNTAMREIWYSNAPPTNNVTALAFDDESNADGSIDVVVSWEYEQGAVTADGFLVYYKSEPDTPDPIVMSSDPAAFIAASPTATAYSHVLPALSARYGGAGAVARHYRFAVVAVGARAGGMIPAASGVVEAAGWTDKTFAPAISFGDDAGFVEIKDGGLYAWKGSGVNRRYGRVSSDGVDFVDAPLTTPASDEVLAARIGRLGVGGPPILDGDWRANIDSYIPGASATVSSSSSTFSYAVASNKSGESICVYIKASDSKLYYKTKSSPSSNFGAETLLVSSVVNQLHDVEYDYDGITVRVAYSISSVVYEIKRVSGTWGAGSSIFSPGVNTHYWRYLVTSDYSLWLVGWWNTGNYCYRSIYDRGADTWGAPSQFIDVSVSSADIWATDICEYNGVVRFIWQDSNHVRERTYDYSAWSSITTLTISFDGVTYFEDLSGNLFFAGSTIQIYKLVSGAWALYGSCSITSSWPRIAQQVDGSILVIGYLSGGTIATSCSRYAQIGAGIIAQGTDPTTGIEWRKYGNGDLEIWGTTNGGSLATVTFPTEAQPINANYESPSFSVFSTYTGFNMYHAYVRSKATTGFTFTAVFDNGSSIGWATDPWSWHLKARWK